MSDLISRSPLLQAMDKRYKEKKDIVSNNLAEGFAQMEKLIKEQPTAYNVDKVVEELEDKAKDRRNRAYMIPNAEVSLFAQYLLGMSVGLENEAIEIVKGGGVNE